MSWRSWEIQGRGSLESSSDMFIVGVLDVSDMLAN